MNEYINFNYNRRLYKGLCAPTSTLAVGLNPCVVVQPDTVDKATVVSNRAALILAVFLPYFLQVLDSDDMVNSYKS